MNRRQISRGLFVAVANSIRRLRHPQKYKSLGFLYDYLDDDKNIKLNKKAQAIRGKIITQICDIHFHYITKNCAAFVTSVKEADVMMRKGAAVLITNKDIEKYPCIISSQPYFVYAKLCRYYRDFQKRATVTVITGSIGKTTTKDMVYSVYSGYYDTFCSRKSSNNTETISFLAQHLPNSAEKYIQEVSESAVSGTENLSYILHPDLAILTTIDKSHFEHFGSEEKIVEQVCLITRHMSPNGKVIVNIDEFKHFEMLNGKEVIGVSVQQPTADYYAENIQITAQGLTFDVVVKKSNGRFKVMLNGIFAPHNVISALCAFAAGMQENIPVDYIIKGLADYRTSGVRQNVFQTHNGILLYADCFNAVARSIRAAIEACDKMSVTGKRIAILGDIEEAGTLSSSIHEEVIFYVNHSKFDILLVFGSKTADAVSKMDIRPSLQVEKYIVLSELSSRLKSLAKEGDLVLLKGSHANNLEQCIEHVWPEDYAERCSEDLAETTRFYRKLFFN